MLQNGFLEVPKPDIRSRLKNSLRAMFLTHSGNSVGLGTRNASKRLSGGSKNQIFGIDPKIACAQCFWAVLASPGGKAPRNPLARKRAWSLRWGTMKSSWHGTWYSITRNVTHHHIGITDMMVSYITCDWVPCSVPLSLQGDCTWSAESLDNVSWSLCIKIKIAKPRFIQ